MVKIGLRYCRGNRFWGFYHTSIGLEAITSAVVLYPGA